MVSQQQAARTAATVVKGPGRGTNRVDFSPLSSLHPSLSSLSPALSRVRTRRPVFTQIQTLGEGFHRSKVCATLRGAEAGAPATRVLWPAPSLQAQGNLACTHLPGLLLPAYQEIRSSSQFLTYFFFSRVQRTRLTFSSLWLCKKTKVPSSPLYHLNQKEFVTFN